MVTVTGWGVDNLYMGIGRTPHTIGRSAEVGFGVDGYETGETFLQYSAIIYTCYTSRLYKYNRYIYINFYMYDNTYNTYIAFIKGSLDEKLPSYEVLKMLKE